MIFALLAVIVVGLATAVEAPTNAFVTKTAGSALWAGLAAAVTGVVAMSLALAVLRPKLDSGVWSATPPYIWFGGLYGSLIVVLTGWATPKLGAGTALVLIVASQVVLGVVLDDFGLLGLKEHAASWIRIVGVLVVIGGALMVSLG